MIEHAGPEYSQPPATPAAPPASRARAIAVATLGFSVTGGLLGALWAWIAAPIHAVVAKTHAGERVHDYLGNESGHFFDAPCLMLGLLTVLAVVAPVLAWQWRHRRGPAMLLGLSIGVVLAATAASAAGAVLVRLRYGALNFDAVPLSGTPAVAYVTQAPPVFFSDEPLQVAATLMWPAGIAALVYALMAAANSRDDLGSFAVGASPSQALPIQPEAPEAAVS